MASEPLRAAWEAVSSRFEGELRPDALIVRHDGCEISAAVHTSHGGVATRLTVATPGALGLRMRILVGRGDVGRGLGARDVRTDEPRIDERYVIKANDSRFALLWMDEPVRVALAESTGYRYVLQAEELTAALPRAEVDAEQLANALCTTAALATRGKRLMDAWISLAANLGAPLIEPVAVWRPDHTISIVKQQRIAITIDGFFGPVRPERNPRLYTRVSAPRTGKLRDHFAITIDDGVMHSDAERKNLLGGRMAGPLRPLLRDAAPSAVIADPNYVRIYFAGFQTSPKRLLAAIRCAESLADEPGPRTTPGPYR